MAAALALAAAVVVATAPATPLRIALPASDMRLALDHAGLAPRGEASSAENRTSVDHRFADGPTASAGYLCGIGGIGPDGQMARTGPASAFQNFGTFLGAKLAYGFR